MNGSTQLTQYEDKIQRIIGAKERIEQELERNTVQLKEAKQELRISEGAQVIIQQVAQKTQEELQYRISELVSLAMESVFDDPYQLDVDFVIRRGKTECDLAFLKNGEKVDPMDATGGGTVDVAAFALQISLWSLQNPKSRSTLILDEPLKFLKGKDLPQKGAAMIAEISERLGIQIIMVSHSDELIESANRVFEVTQNKRGVSKVVQL